MVEFLSDWSGQLVVAIIVGSILEMLVPKGKNKKYVKMLIGIYIVFCIVSPFTKINESFSADNIDETIDKFVEQNTEEVDQTSMDAKLEQLYIEEVEKNITEDLANIGYKVMKCKIEVSLNNKVNNSTIQSINLKVKKYIRKNTSSEIENIEGVEKVDISINNKEKEDTTYIENEDINKIKSFILEKYDIEEHKIHISG
ncbi:MAG: stage III sporulation protein AF [Clostridia bacterium]|nr:stage III sporulation protein AF [Clostridia bacterium]